TVANNYVDHGLYQISPILFEQLCHESTGLRLRKLDVIEYGPRIRNWSSKAKQTDQTGLASKWHVVIYVEIEKLRDDIQDLKVQQRSYDSTWQQPASKPAASRPGLSETLLNLVPGLIRGAARFWRRRSFTLGTRYAKKRLDA
ncbi:MAG: hypothetical protein ACKVYV_07095, partial [Limisphaerales bacterium]